MKAVIELDERTGRRLEDLARRQGTTLEQVVERAVSDFAERLPEMSPTAPSNTALAALPVVHGTRPVTLEELKQAIADADDEDGLKGLGLTDDATPGR